MSSDDRSTSRAEARRRARLAARGELPEPEPSEIEAEPERPSARGFLRRLFPPAPRFPVDRTRSPASAGAGRSAPFTERIYLLRHNLVAWVRPGWSAVVGYFASLLVGPQSVIGLVGTFVLFGALIAAGWFGWQRPTLYGTAAALVGFVGDDRFVLYSFAQQGATPATFGPRAIFDRLPPGAVPVRPRLPGRLVRRLPAAPAGPARRKPAVTCVGTAAPLSP